MGHNLELLAGPELAVRLVMERWPRARAFALRPGATLYCVPIDPNSMDDHPDEPGAGVVERWGDPTKATAQEIAAVAALTIGTALAYLVTNYFGGNGYQGSVLWIDGTTIGPPETTWNTELHNRPRADWPINRALRGLGLDRGEHEDEFDALGLGLYRDFERLVERAQRVLT